MQNSTLPDQFSIRPAHNALALVSRQALISLTVTVDGLTHWPLGDVNLILGR